MIGRMRPFYQAHWDISKDIKHVWLLFCTYYIAWIFQWILGDEWRGEWWLHQVHRADRQHRVWTPQCAASWMLLLYAGDSSRWLLTPGPQFLSRGAQTFWHRAYSIITSRTTSVLYLNLKRGRMCWNLSFVRLKVILCLSSFMQWFDEPCCPTWRNSINMSNQQVRSLVNDFLKLNGQPLAFSLKRVNNERKDNWFSFHAAPRVSTNIYTKRAYIRVCIKPPRAKKTTTLAPENPHTCSPSNICLSEEKELDGIINLPHWQWGACEEGWGKL